MRPHLLLPGIILLHACVPVLADTPALPPAIEPAVPATLTDELIALPVLYSDPANPVIQELDFTGSYNLQYYNVDSAQGDASGWDQRRIRWGARLKFLHDFELKGQVNSNADAGKIYDGIRNLTLTWNPAEEFSLTVGKFKPRWSYEWPVSSIALITFERSLLTNQARPENVPGVAIAGSASGWDWSIGVFSGDGDPDFGDWDLGAFYNASIGRDMTGLIPTDSAHWRLDCMIDDGEPGKTGKGPWEQNFSTSLELIEGRCGLVLESLFVTGNTDAAWGLMLMPSFDITKKLQAVARYQYAHAEGDVLRVARRYEREAPQLSDDGYGDTYHAVYLGLNYRIHGDHLKLMGGAEYARMNGGGDGGDYNGWTWLGGIRVYF